MKKLWFVNSKSKGKSKGKGKGKGKDKVYPRTRHKGTEGEQRYSSTLSLTSAVNSGGWSTPRPGRFTPGERDPVPIVYRRLGAPQGQFGQVQKISSPPGFDPRNAEPVSAPLYRNSGSVQAVRPIGGGEV
jgi:hypothetical protein